jgi:hypothetical protein
VNYRVWNPTIGQVVKMSDRSYLCVADGSYRRIERVEGNKVFLFVRKLKPRKKQRVRARREAKWREQGFLR